jgi:hypothetical protein
VDDPRLVRRAEALADLPQDREHPPRLDLLLRQAARSVPLSSSMQKNRRPSGSSPKSKISTLFFEPGAGRCAGLLAEHLRRVAALAQLGPQDLQRHAPLDVDVLGLVDDPHAALAEPRSRR